MIRFLLGALTAAILSATSGWTYASDTACARNAIVAAPDGVALGADCHPGPADRTLVFVHGWSQARLVWERQVSALAGDFRIISFDLRGHGASGRPDNADAYAGRWVHAQDIGAIFDHFGTERCAIVVGWSFGAVAASDAAVRLGPARICGAVFVAGPVRAGSAESTGYFGPLMAKTAAMRDGPADEKEEQAVERFLIESRRHGAWDREYFSRLRATNLTLSPQDRRRVAIRPPYDNTAALNASGIPVLLVHGDSDPVYRYQASVKAYEELQHAQLAIYPGIGHWPFLEKAERFNADLRAFADQVFDGDGPLAD